MTEPDVAQPAAVLGSAQSGAPQDTPISSKSGRRRAVLFGFLLLALILAARWLGLGGQVDALRTWIKSLGSFGPFVFVVLYTVGTVAAVPGLLMTVMGGALFGSAVGFLVVTIGSTLGACLAFLAARYVARDAVSRWLSQQKSFHRLNQLTEERGAWMVALTRLIPLFPFNLVNYGFGLTRIPFRTYAFWSGLCMLPATLVYVVGSDAITQIIEGHVSRVVMGVLATSAVAFILLIRFARRAWKKRVLAETPVRNVRQPCKTQSL